MQMHANFSTYSFFTATIVETDNSKNVSKVEKFITEREQATIKGITTASHGQISGTKGK